MIAAVILSAGESRRMGSPKALLPYPRAGGSRTSFVAHLIDVFHRSHAEPVLVVLGHEPDAIRKSIEADATRVDVLENRRYREGMLSSIQTAIAHLSPDSRVEGALICPVDHPEVTPQLVDALIERFRATGASIVLPTHRGRRGHPVLFGRAVFEELLRAPETVGARQVVWDHESNLIEVEVSEPGIGVDVDTPEAYRKLIERAEDGSD